MAIIFSFLHSPGKQFSTEDFVRPTGFIPLDADQMNRMKGGFDTEGDAANDTGGETEPDPDDDPLAGDPQYEEPVE